jgi:hypothetical protein
MLFPAGVAPNLPLRAFGREYLELPYPSAEYRLSFSLHFAEPAVIGGVVRARSVHKVGYGHNCDWAAA